MRWTYLAAAGVLAAVAAPARAQERHFEQPYWDTNRSDRIIYYPLARAFSGPRPGTQPYSVAAASWYKQNLGARDMKPDNVLDGGDYRLERFDAPTGRGTRTIHVVIVRHPAPPEEDVPLLKITHSPSLISVTARPQVTARPDGVEYSYTITPPTFGYTLSADAADPSQAPRYQLDLLTERNVKLPSYITKAPTFGGVDWKSRSDQPPPQLPYAERVAGKRIEYRSGRVVTDKEKAK